ncbi:MAG: S8 family serine peptidase [Bacteroidota bacterium]
MKKYGTLYLFAAALIGAGCDNLPNETANSTTPDTRSQQTITSEGKELIPGQYIVVLKDNISQNAVESVANQMAATHSAAVDRVFKNAVKGFAARMSPQQADALAHDPNVKFIEQDQIMRISSNGSGSGDAIAAQSTPWGVTRIGGAGDGTGKVAWIIDTGIDLTHPDLNVDRTRSRNFSTGSSANDGNGHGTHVAGTIAAKNNTVGVIGVAAGASVVAVRVLNNQGSGSYSAIISGVDYVAANAAAGDVANMSLGGSASTALDNAVTNLASKGVKVVLAAGNESTSATTKSPARVNGTNIYTISAIGSNGAFASFSNYGNPPVDYAAPGVNVLSLWKGGGTNTISGTSMAAPHAAGVLLLGSATTDGNATSDPDGTADPIIHR